MFGGGRSRHAHAPFAFVTKLQLKARITAHVAFWRDRLALAGWDLAVLWEAPPIARAKFEGADALCIVGRRSMSADLVFSLPKLARYRDDAAVEAVVVHELLHALSDGLREAEINVISRALVRARRGAP